MVDRATWQAERDALLVREKAHTREGDAIAAARRRLPMVEMDPTITLIGPHGPVTLLEVFEGRRQLIAHFHMWHAGQPAAQCEGCTFYNGQIRELSYLHSRDITYATFCQGPYNESVRYRDFMGWDVPWYSAQDSADALLAGRRSFMLVSYLRHAHRVFETYWTSGRGVEAMAPSYGLLDMTVHGPAGNLGGLARRLAGSLSRGWRAAPAGSTASRLSGTSAPTREPRASAPLTISWAATEVSAPGAPGGHGA